MGTESYIMKNKINTIEQKINKLKEQKQKLTSKTAEDLYVKLEKIIEDDFLPQMVLGIVSNVFKDASQKQREEWIKSGSTFWGKVPKQRKAVESDSTKDK